MATSRFQPHGSQGLRSLEWLTCLAPSSWAFQGSCQPLVPLCRPKLHMLGQQRDHVHRFRSLRGACVAPLWLINCTLQMTLEVQPREFQARGRGLARAGQGHDVERFICSTEHARDTDANADWDEVLFTTTSSHSAGLPGSSTWASQEFAAGKSHGYDLASSLRPIIRPGNRLTGRMTAFCTPARMPKILASQRAHDSQLLAEKASTGRKQRPSERPRCMILHLTVEEAGLQS